ncbi:hypothetical protein M2T79_09545 [Elizabethkingia miricola]|uniref:hypothetical protein n=1 Tax=Elizabethkingia miricola TaxID=172045 RepID=UPI00201856E2|nr:hypothetical protein [Elizabethkingia miricola]MCL1656841.1 hypothetical protein [Elizabethkingia miricola]
MKINVTVDLADLYSEENEENIKDLVLQDLRWKISTELKTFLNERLNLVKEELKKQIQETIAIKIEPSIPKIVGELVSEKFFNDDYKIKKYGTEYSVKEYVEGIINKTNDLARESVEKYLEHLSSENTKKIKTQAEEKFKKIHEKYDLLFASQIVSKLGEKGMLKQDVAKLLLEN